MHIASGKVINGQVVVDGDLPEGSDVTLIAIDGDTTFHVDAGLEAVLLESMAQGELGETIAAEDLIAEMRSREWPIRGRSSSPRLLPAQSVT